MNQAHLHLLFNHLPVIGTVVGLLILLAGFVVKQPLIKRTALGVFIFSAICVIPSYLTGEGAEEVVEGVAGIGESYIESHEDLASLYLWSIGALGVVALISLLLDIRPVKNTPSLYLLVLGLSIVSVGISFRLGVTGGEIRHTEIRSGNITQADQPTIRGGEDNDD